MVVGLDVHKKETVGFVVRAGMPLESGTWVSAKTTREGLLELLPALEGELVLIEASTSGKTVARFLRARGVRVDLLTADVLAAHVRRAKSDKLDARDLARIGLVGGYRTCYIPTADEEEVRALVRLVRDFHEQKVRVKNQIKAIAQRNLVPEPLGKLENESTRKRWARLSSLLPAKEAFALQSKLTLLGRLIEQDEAARLEIHRLVRDDPNVHLLLGIKGVDVYAAAAVVSHYGDMTRFPDPKKAASYAGLTPRLIQSGGTVAVGGRITKAGPNLLRHVLIEATHVAVQYPGRLQAKFTRLKPRRGAGRAIVACARTLAHIVWAMLTRHEVYQDAEDELAAAKAWRLQTVASLLDDGLTEAARAVLNTLDVRRLHATWLKGRSRLVPA